MNRVREQGQRTETGKKEKNDNPQPPALEQGMGSWMIKSSRRRTLACSAHHHQGGVICGRQKHQGEMDGTKWVPGYREVTSLCFTLLQSIVFHCTLLHCPYCRGDAVGQKRRLALGRRHGGSTRLFAL